jgi:hypothetical protein
LVSDLRIDGAAQRISNEIGESQCCRFTDANL